MAIPPPKSTERFHEIDLLRALACLMVVLFHLGYRGALDGWSPAADPAWIAPLVQYGYLGVHLFFIISGFVIFLSIRHATPREFVASRVARLYPAFWIAVPITFAVVSCWGSPDLRVSWQHMLVNLTMVPHWFHVPYVDGAYWSLAVELQFYILVGLALQFKLVPHAERLLAGWLVIALVNAIRPMYPVEFWLAANWAPLFTIGALAYRIRSQGATAERLGLMALAYALAIWYAIKPVLAHKDDHESIWVVLILVSAFVLGFVMIAFGKLKIRQYALFTTAGALTYPVYLLHEYIGYVFLSRLTLNGWTYLAAACAVFAGIVALAWCLNRGVERPLSPRLRSFVQGKNFAALPA